MSLPSPASKKSGKALAPLIAIAVFALIGVGVTAIIEQRSLQGNGSISSSGILGEWRTADAKSRIIFRPDKTLGMGAAAPASLEPGEYQLESAGVVLLNLKDGRAFTATFREFTPNQFDLVDTETQSVKVYVKAP